MTSGTRTPARGRGRRLAAACGLAACLAVGVAPSLAAAQPPSPDPAHETAAAEGAHGEQAHGEEAHGESIWAFLSRIGNFLILAGGLYYLLRSPIARYLDARSQQIRGDLVSAADLRANAAARLAEIETRLAALPGEIDRLKARGRDEIAAEQARIAQTAQTERERLVELTRREIERQLQLARRELTEHAADLAVGVARARLPRELTADRQAALIDRYAADVGDRHE